MIALGIANHIVLTGNRITVSLEALRLGASAAVVGVLLALYALLPMMLRGGGGTADRPCRRAAADARRFDRAGGRVRVAGAGARLRPAVRQRLPSWASGSCCSSSPRRMRPASWASRRIARTTSATLALGYAISGFVGPLVAGFTIDHGGFAVTFAVLRGAAAHPRGGACQRPAAALPRSASGAPAGPCRQRARAAQAQDAAARVLRQRAAGDGLGPAHDRDPGLRRQDSGCRHRRSA